MTEDMVPGQGINQLARMVLPLANPQVTMSKTPTALARSPVHLLHRAAQAVEDLFAAQVGETDITPRQLAVLATVAENEGISQTGIVNITGIDRSTLADIVRRLTKKGLLQRRRTKADARAYAVTLTDKGEEMLRAAGPQAKKVDQRIMQAVGSKDEFLSRLQAIIEKLQPVTA